MKFPTVSISLINVLLSAAAANDCQQTTVTTTTQQYDCVGQPEIAVFGHRSPDTDAILSAIIYAWELQYPTPSTIHPLVCSKAYINTNEPNRETVFVLDYFNVDVPPIIDEITNETIFATVDTNNIDEMPNGITNEIISNNLHSIVDHHKLTGLVTTKPINIDIRSLGSAGSVLYQRSIEANRPIPGKNDNNCDDNINIAGLMMATILSDTLNLQSPTTTQLDIDAVTYLAPLASVDDVDDFFNQMIDAKSDLSGISPMEIIMLDSKIYEFIDFEGNKFDMRISVLENSRTQQIFDMSKDISDACDIQLALDKERYPTMRSLLFFAIDIINQKATYIPCSTHSEYDRQLVLQGEYPDLIGTPTELYSEHGYIELDGVQSRKLQLIPGLTVSSEIVPYYYGDSDSDDDIDIDIATSVPTTIATAFVDLDDENININNNNNNNNRDDDDDEEESKDSEDNDDETSSSSSSSSSTAAVLFSSLLMISSSSLLILLSQ